MGPHLHDSFGRSFQYLRLSVTDVCNFRCVYCLPSGYQKPEKQESPLAVAEIQNLVSALSEMGLWKVRLTGGEPTVRKDVLEIARTISEVPGVKRLALTTNGYRLTSLAQPLFEAGVTNLNVSVDSLDAQRFWAITGQDRLKDILRGIDAAFEAGFSTVKINVVLLRDWNEVEFDRFLAWARRAPVRIRFIELMQTGGNAELFKKHHLSGREIQFKLFQEGWKIRPRTEGDGPALEFEHPDYEGSIGLIAPYSKDFCKTCNRLRVSSVGGLRLCLFGEKDFDLRPYLQSDSQKEELIQLIHSLIRNKSQSHQLDQGIFGNTAQLASIGG